MRQNNNKNLRILTLAALVFLFCTRWMLYRLERTEINIPCFAAECALFLLLYTLCLFRAPPVIQMAALLFGCAAIMGLYAVSETVYSTDVLLPVTWFSAFLFLIDQNEKPAQKRTSLLLRIISSLMLLYPWFVIGAVVYTAITKENGITVRTVCCLILSALLSAVYTLIMRAPLKKTHKKQTHDKNGSEKRLRSSFRFAVIAVPVSFLYPALTGNVVAAETLLILWAANLPLLYLLEHPLLTSFAASFSHNQKES